MKSLLATLALTIALLTPSPGSARPADPDPPAAAAAPAAGTPGAAVSSVAPAATAVSPAPPAAATSGAASAPNAPESAAAGDATKAATAGKVVCRTVRVTGSRLRTERVCSSRSSAQEAQDWLQRQQEGGANRGAEVNGGG